MLTNPRADRVKAVRSLSKRSVRARTGRFVVEGPQGVREAVRHAPGRVIDVYATVTSARRYASDIVEPARAAGLYVHETSDEVLAATLRHGDLHQQRVNYPDVAAEHQP